MNDFIDKNVFITGVGSGMGLASAKRLAAEGAHVVGFDRTGAAATRAAIESCRRDATQRVRLYVADVSDRAASLDVLARAVADCGAPDLVIHMAGVGGIAEMATMPFEMFDRMMKINLYGTRNVVEALLPSLRQRASAGTHPKLVLVASLAGYVPVYGYTAYGTSKFAAVGFAKCLRAEFAPLGIDVTSFCPGEVMTPGLAAEREATHPAARALKEIGGTISMETAIDGLVKGIRRRNPTIIPGWRARLLYLVFRLTPERIWNAIADAIVRSALGKVKSASHPA